MARGLWCGFGLGGGAGSGGRLARCELLAMPSLPGARCRPQWQLVR